MASHGLKYYTACHFNFLDLVNVVVLFMIPLASCDATLVPVVSDDQKVMLHLIWMSGVNKCNCAIDSTISITWNQNQH